MRRNPRRTLAVAAAAGLALALLAVLGCAHEATTSPLSTARTAASTEIATFPLALYGGGEADLLSALTLSLTIRPGGYADSGATPRYELFGRDTIRDGDEGKTLVATADDDPDFSAFVALLTDGIDEEVDLWFEGGGTVTRESTFFTGRPGQRPDFKGYVIDRIEFRVDSVLIASPGRNPNLDGFWTDYDLGGRLVLLGHSASGPQAR